MSDTSRHDKPELSDHTWPDGQPCCAAGDEDKPALPVDAMVLVSDCCGGRVRVAGRTTQHYECRACGKPCDAVPGQPADWDAINRRWIAQ